jgi:hypothetical protein
MEQAYSQTTSNEIRLSNDVGLLVMGCMSSMFCALHLPARHPNNFPEIELSPDVQVRHA